MPMKTLGAFAAFFYGTYGHSNMVYPPTWTDRFAGQLELKSDMWFNNDTYVTGARTIPAGAKSYNQAAFQGSAMETHPWMKPGTAERREGGYAPCGVAGGNPEGCPNGNPNGVNCPGGGYGFGQDAFEMNLMEGAPVTEWQAGGSEEVGFRILANHGGGYSYRLCPVGPAGEMTEACFQAGALDFDGDTSWIDFDEEGEETRIEFQNQRVTVGTPPKADGTPQQWSRNPVPACNSADGGLLQFGGAGCDDRGMCNCRGGTQFAAPAPGVEGYGTHILALGRETFVWSVRDKVVVPETLPEGNYVLSFRWDCEQTAQSWATCSSIYVKAAENQAGNPDGTDTTGTAPVPVTQPPPPPANQCNQELVEPAVRSGVIDGRFGLIGPCQDMGEELLALQADPAKEINSDAICGCVTGFPVEFWQEPPLDCELMPGVTFEAIHGACSAGLDLNDVKPATNAPPINGPGPVTPPTPPITRQPPTPVRNPTMCASNSIMIMDALQSLALINPACNDMNQEFSRLMALLNVQPNYDIICGCMSGISRMYWTQPVFQCELTMGNTWADFYDQCAANSTPVGTGNNPPNPIDNNAPACDEAALQAALTAEIATNLVQLIQPCLNMQAELLRSRMDGDGQPDQQLVCGCVNGFERSFWNAPTFMCQLDPTLRPGVTWGYIADECAKLVNGGNNGLPGPTPVTPRGNPVNTPVNGPTTNQGGQANPNRGDAAPNNGGGVTVVTDGNKMDSNMVPLYGGAAVVAAMAVGLILYKRSSGKPENAMAYNNMGTGAPGNPQGTLSGQQTAV